MRAGSRSRQQCRSSPQGAEEEDAARGHFPRDETPRSLRKAIGKKSKREGRGDPPRPQARAQAPAARGPAADEAEAGRRRRRRKIRAAARAAFRLNIAVTLPMARVGLGPRVLFGGGSIALLLATLR